MFRKEKDLPNNQIAENTAAYYRSEALKHKAAVVGSLKTFLKTGLFTVVGTVTLAILSAAWFANNASVDAKGITVTAAPPPGMVIAKSVEEIKVATLSETEVSFSEDDAVTLNAATHNTSGSGEKKDSNLLYNKNPAIISASTGYKFQNKELNLVDAVNDEEKGKLYYKDFTVYIASANEPFDIETLDVSMSTELNSLKDTYYSASIDFYVNGTYKGTLNLAQKDYLNVSKETIASQTILENVTIPYNSGENGYFEVTMRLYFDGNLEKEEGQAYLYSDELTLDAFAIDVQFTAQ